MYIHTLKLISIILEVVGKSVVARAHILRILIFELLVYFAGCKIGVSFKVVFEMNSF